METMISEATKNNWSKLNTNFASRLTMRANKTLSNKKIFPTEYLTNKQNIIIVQELISFFEKSNHHINDYIYSIAVQLLLLNGILKKAHVQKVLEEYNLNFIEDIAYFNLPNDERDFLGLVYQSILFEGKKNSMGSYYTPQKVVSNMVSTLDFSNGETFLDPCCGSGSFFLNLGNIHPAQIFGCDTDEIAVMIAKVNLLLKYKHLNFIPQIYHFNFLKEQTSSSAKHEILSRKFDYIVTNPPWGAMQDNKNISEAISSKETFSYFFVKSFQQLKINGLIRFLFPESILNVKVHKDIRNFMLEKTRIKEITRYDTVFSGVLTKYIDIQCLKSKPAPDVLVIDGKIKKNIPIENFLRTENKVFSLASLEDIALLNKIKNKGVYTLANSVWALGIVTGDNKNKLKNTHLDGYEPIFTGKEIAKYTLGQAKKYIVYDRTKLQQVAKDEIYRAHEKLAYKFVSNKLTFSYDNKKHLFLNSANILIPKIPNMRIKTVLAFLNSELFQYFYKQLFGEIKILKGNLCELTFPQISPAENIEIETLVNQILDGDICKDANIQRKIFDIYALSEDEILYIKKNI